MWLWRVSGAWWAVFCGRCHLCGYTVEAGSYEEAKRLLREHLLRVHGDWLRVQEGLLRRMGRVVPGRGLSGLAGYIASMLVYEC